MHWFYVVLVTFCHCLYCGQKIQLRFRFIFDIVLMILKKIFFLEVLELFFSSKLSRQNFAVQSVAYFHKDSLFKDKVKPIHQNVIIQLLFANNLDVILIQS